MYRRDISKALVGMAAGSAMLPRAAGAATTCTATPVSTLTQPGWAQTAAEMAAINPQTMKPGITPVNYCYPPMWADRYTNNATPGTTDMTFAIQAAIAVAQVQGSTGQTGERVILQATTYMTSKPIVVPAGVTVQGAGGAGIPPNNKVGPGTNIYYTGTFTGGIGSAAIQLGNSLTSLTFFPAVADLAITLVNDETYGVQFLCTANASARNIYVFNPSTTHQAQTGFIIGYSSGSAQVSSFWNTLVNCYSQWCHNGFMFSMAPTYPTQSTFIQCSATGLYAENDTTGGGVVFAQPNDGEFSTFVDCYLTSFANGVYLSQTPNVTFVGTEFESCGNDIRWSGSDLGVTFIAPPRTLTQTGTPGTACGTLYGSTPTTGTQTAMFVASNKPGAGDSAPAAWLPVFVPNASGGATYYVPLWT